MSVKNDLMLEPRQLNDVDNAILDFMIVEGDRVNPGYISEEIDQSRSYVSQRLKRLKEHGHVDQPHRGLWELVDDPRSGDVELPEDLHEIGFVKEFKIFDDAEAVKTVRFVGTRGTTDIQITDQTMVEFAAIAKEVFTRIHGDIDLLRELLDEYDG